MVKANLEQQEVINDLSNNILLFASAGTGKTFTVAKRVENIIKNKNIKPEEILCLTFTVKACNEMKEDIISHVGEDGKNVEVRTIHSFLYQILKIEEKKAPTHYSDIAICDDVDEEQILRRILFENLHLWLTKKACKTFHFSFEKVNLQKAYLSHCFKTDERTHKEFRSHYFIKFKVPFLDKRLEVVVPTREASVCGGEWEEKIFCINCRREVISNMFCPYCGVNCLEPYYLNTLGILNKKSGLSNFASFVKEYYYRFRVFDEFDNDIDAYQAAYERAKATFPKIYSQCISFYDRECGMLEDSAFDECMSCCAGEFIYEYNNYLARSNLIDFGDIIGKAYIRLDDFQVKRFWREKYKYIIVDEMQDTSEFEFETLKKIFGNNNIMMCGDFFQTIYAWRGSNPEKVLGDYKKGYKAKTYMFSENYRATQKLAGASFGFLKNMFGLLVGEYCPSEIVINSREKGDNIKIISCDSNSVEAFWIYNYIKNLNLQDFSKVCIMSRTNSYLADLVDRLEKIANDDANKLKFFTIEKFFQFYRRPLVKDFMAFLKIIINPFDNVSMSRIARNYVTGVGAVTINKIERYNPIGVNLASFVNPIVYQEEDLYTPLINAKNNHNIVIYDTESTGLDLEKDQIIQLSAIKIDCNGNVLEIFDQMIIPTVEISKGAYQTHGFDLDYISKHGGISAKDALVKFTSFVKGAVLVGHNNLAYDRPLLNREIQDNGLKELDVANEYDTLPISKQFLPKLKNYKLSTLCDYFNVVNEDAHNAVGDIIATGKVLVNLINDFIVPTQIQRVEILSKYKPKFEKVYHFFEKLRRYINASNLRGMVDFMCDTLKFELKYENSKHTVEELKELFDNKSKLKPMLFIQEFLTSASFSASQINTLIEKFNRVPLITVHESKGCEFDTVIVVGCTENNFPSYFAKLNHEEEEEKKVFYVAISRAKKKLVLTYVPKTYGKKISIERSPYISFIPEEMIDKSFAYIIKGELRESRW